MSLYFNEFYNGWKGEELMLKYKWCVCDMDGTLLNSKKAISEENEKALKKLQKEGTEIIIASGRIDHLLKSYIEQLGLTGPVICCNGGLIKDIKTGKVLYSKVLDRNLGKEMLQYCFENNLEFLIYTADYIYANEDNAKGIRYVNLNKSLPDSLKIPVKFVDENIIESVEKDSMDILKILLICGDTDEVKVVNDKFSAYDNLTIVKSAELLLDVMASNISKGNGLKILSEKLNVNLSEVISFGDNYNDVDMFKYTGTPIAMGNAVEDAKKAAKYVTKTNNESGVAYAINNFILADQKI